jgi:hypothetical protein
MAQPLQSRIPIITLDSGCVVQFEAVDATTGAVVTGVTVSDVSIYAVHAGPGNAKLVPTDPEWLNLPQEG